MRVCSTLMAIWIGGCAGCGSASDPAGLDAGLDAPIDARNGCEDFEPDARRACVPAGSFLFGVVNDQNRCPECSEESLRLQEESLREGRWLAHEVFTPAFLIDLHEVSIGEYAEYLAATGAAPPPERCRTPLVAEACRDLVEPTGWSADGTPPEGRLGEPVDCVSRAEARQFCAWQAGRLPTAVEWMKAGRGLLPNDRQIPRSEDATIHEANILWVEEVSHGSFDSLYPPTDPRYCEYFDFRGPELVTARPENASPFGLLHMLGNVAEMVEVAASDDAFEAERFDIFGGGYSNGTVLDGCADGWQYNLSFGISSAKCYERLYEVDDVRDRSLGFRCAYDRGDD